MNRRKRKGGRQRSDGQPSGRQHSDGQPSDRQPSSAIEELAGLAAWELVEEKAPYSKDREMFIVVLGSSIVVVSLFLQAHLFAFFIALASGFVVYRGRQMPRTLSFEITTHGVLMGRDFVPLENIHAYNIVDDPGERARLILLIQKYLPIAETVPVYDVDIARVEDSLVSLGVKKNKELEVSLLHSLVPFL